MKNLIPLLLLASASVDADNLKLDCFFERNYERSNGLSIEVDLITDTIKVTNEYSDPKRTIDYPIEKKSTSSFAGVIDRQFFQNHLVVKKLNETEYSVGSAQIENGLLNSAWEYYCK